jgi:hypothetical protein
LGQYIPLSKASSPKKKRKDKDMRCRLHEVAVLDREAVRALFTNSSSN